MIAAGRWVRIHRVVLAPSDRAPGLPEDTASVPFESWINGWLVEGAEIGAEARITTMTGRQVDGRLVAIDPGYTHSFGSPPPALQRAARHSLELLFAKGEP